MMDQLLRAIKRRLGQVWFGLFEAFLPLATSAPASCIVLIRADGVGDLLFSLPLLEAIRQDETTRRTVLLCDHGAESLVRSLGIVDETIPFERRRYRRDPFYRWKVWKALRRVRAQKAVSLQYHRSPTSDELLLATGAPETIALSGNNELISDSDRRSFDRRFSRVVEVSEHARERDRYDLLSRSCGWSLIDWERTYRPSRELSTTRRDVHAEPAQPAVIAIAPGGSSSIRQWPESRWVELVHLLSDSAQIRCLLVGGPPDRSLIGRIASKCTERVGVEIGADLLEVARTVARVNIVVGIDSGISHLAARIGIPCVVLLGGGHFVRYFPYATATTCFARQDCYECDWHCHRDRVYCMTEIAVQSVAGEVRRRLGMERGRSHGA